MPIGNPVQVTLAFSNAVAIALIIMRALGIPVPVTVNTRFFQRTE